MKDLSIFHKCVSKYGHGQRIVLIEKYLIVNLANGKYYVGSAVTGNLYMRFHRHLFSHTGNVLVANAVKKYGLNEFFFSIRDCSSRRRI